MLCPDAGAPVFSCRRLLRPDLNRLCGLYKKSLAPNAVPPCSLVQSWFDSGLCFGAFCGGTLVASLTVLPYASRLSPAFELRSAKCIRPIWKDEGWLCCSFAAAPQMPTAVLAEALLRFCCAVLERSGPSPVLTAVLPVKTATAALAPFLASGLSLCAVRPLRNLTPCYILEPAKDDITGESLTLPLENTLQISHALEDGWRGRAVRRSGLVLMR